MTIIRRPRVIIIGAGFGGLYAAKQFGQSDAEVILIDRQNYHLFTPLLYQVATSGLEPGEIAYPVRGIIRNMRNVRFLMGQVEAIDPAAQTVTVRSAQAEHVESYDYLIVATGSQTHYFNSDAIERNAFGLKSLAEAVLLRNHLLKCFESAAWNADSLEREALTTLVVVGGGPTGLETAGALAELVRYVLRKEFATQIEPVPGRVILVEAQPHLLEGYPMRLRQAALRQLEELGVETILGASVITASPDQIVLSDGRVIPTRTIVWAAGVKGSPVAHMLGVALQRGDRVPVLPTLQVPDLPNVYVVGDLAYLEDQNGKPYPMLIPVAKQQGILAARNILRQMQGEPLLNFSYSGLKDRGVMATVGRSRAVAWVFYRLPISGFLAWWAWLVLHLITLMGFRNRLNVFINWVWNYLTYDRSVRLILEHQNLRAAPDTILLTPPSNGQATSDLAVPMTALDDAAVLRIGDITADESDRTNSHRVVQALAQNN